MNAEIVVQSILGGLAAGGVYALVALGFGIAYRTTKVFNFAQGTFGALGAYLAYTCFVDWGLPFWLAALFSTLVVAAVAIVTERLALRPLYKRGELYTFISTIGLGLALESAILLIWGPIPKTMPSIFGNEAVEFLGLRAVPELLWIAGLSLVLAALTGLFLKRTRIGIAMRGCAQDREMASLVGISVNQMYAAAFAISGMMGALAGILVAPTIFLRPSMGVSLGLPGFIAALVGGLGSVPGAVLGGLTVGVAQALSVFLVSPQYRDIALYSILALVILLKPSGLFGEEAVEARYA